MKKLTETLVGTRYGVDSFQSFDKQFQLYNHDSDLMRSKTF
jgi:hypothetical protein